MAWHVCSAVATGSSHVDGGIPCQDACASEHRGDLLVAVVCDGAGSRTKSDVGAALISAGVVQRLATHFGETDATEGACFDDIKTVIATAIVAVREVLTERARSEQCEIGDYAATIVGVVADASGGVLFHIGDGIGVAIPIQQHVELVLSVPENGEYANETYFVTGEDWLEHLRVKPFPFVANILLMSDGAMPFVMAKGATDVYHPFVNPVTAFLPSVSESEGSTALAATLSDPRTHQITSDDKTLLVALRK